MRRAGGQAVTTNLLIAFIKTNYDLIYFCQIILRKTAKLALN